MPHEVWITESQSVTRLESLKINQRAHANYRSRNSYTFCHTEYDEEHRYVELKHHAKIKFGKREQATRSVGSSVMA